MSSSDTTDRRSLAAVFGGKKPLVGMVHLRPLPGSPRWGGSIQEVIEQAVADGLALAEGGLDGVIVENFFDAPFYAERVPPETVAAMTRAVTEIGRELSIPLGINVLRNDAISALGVATATEASFIRVNVHTGATLTDQGWIQGAAETTLRTRRALMCDSAILADVFVKHGRPAPGVTIEAAARDCWDRGLADGLIVTGGGTGEPTSVAIIRAVKKAVPHAPVWVGSGATASTVGDLLSDGDGVIVGSALHLGGRLGAGIDRARVADFTEAARRARHT